MLLKKTPTLGRLDHYAHECRVGFFWFPEWVFFFPAVFFSWIWFFSSCLGFFQFPLVFSVPVVGVFGSRLNTVFLVPTFGCFQFPFFFGRSCLLWVRQLPSRSCHGCFRLRLPVVVVVVGQCCFGFCGWYWCWWCWCRERRQP